MNKKEYVLDYDAGSFYADENGELIFEHEEPYIDLPDGYSVVQDVEGDFCNCINEDGDELKDRDEVEKLLDKHQDYIDQCVFSLFTEYADALNQYNKEHNIKTRVFVDTNDYYHCNSSVYLDLIRKLNSTYCLIQDTYASTTSGE